MTLIPKGVLRILSDGDDQRIFWGLKFSIPGFFWVGKFGKYFFCVWLDLSGNLIRTGFFGSVQNNLKISDSARKSITKLLLWLFKALHCVCFIKTVI